MLARSLCVLKPLWVSPAKTQLAAVGSRRGYATAPTPPGHTQFIVIAYDGTDSKALERRTAVREAHLVRTRKAKAEGKVVYGGAILDGEGKMIGSVMLLNNMTKDETERYLAEDPYVKDGVWQKYDIKPFRLAKEL